MVRWQIGFHDRRGVGTDFEVRKNRFFRTKGIGTDFEVRKNRFSRPDEQSLPDKKKPYIISVAGLTLQDNIQIITDLRNTAVDSIELNLSCPNIVGKSQVAYDPETMELYLRKIFDINDHCTETNPIHMLGIKLSPYFDHEQFVRCADIVKEFPVKYVTCINSIGYGLIVDTDTERTVICPNAGHGGIGGKVVLPIALSNVRKFRQRLPDRIDVVGCGGVTNGNEVFQHILVGATAVQVGTQLMREGVGVFSRLNKELVSIMRSKGYTNIADFRGKLVERTS